MAGFIVIPWLFIIAAIGFVIYTNRRDSRLKSEEVYRLAGDESVIYKTTKLVIDGGRYEKMQDEGELVITNKRLIWIYYTGMFTSRRKDCEVFQYTDIKKVNGEPNIRIDENSEPMRLYFNFRTGDPEFYQKDDGTDEIEVFEAANAVRTVFGIAPVKKTEKHKKALPGSKAIATMIRDTKNVFKDVFNEGEEKEPETKNISCPGCGNKMVVVKGVTKFCEYCGTQITL